MDQRESSSLVPEPVLDSAKTTLADLEQVEIHLLQFLSQYDPEDLAEMPPLQRAHSLFFARQGHYYSFRMYILLTIHSFYSAIFI